MNHNNALEKIHDLRTEEKNQALLEQKKAVDQFEQVAKQLYKQLKTKEEAESKLNMYKQSEVIMKIREQTLYIGSLNERINVLQNEVQIARKQMEEKQYIVTEKHIELKKIEKMIEKRRERVKKQAEVVEMQQMDEISLNRYIRAE